MMSTTLRIKALFKRFDILLAYLKLSTYNMVIIPKNDGWSKESRYRMINARLRKKF